MHAIISTLLSAAVVFGVSKVTPGVRIRGFGTAIAVAVVYAVLTFLLHKVLVIISLPAIVLTFGLFLLVINAFLLWLTDKLVDGFEIDGKGPLAIATIGMTVGNWLVHMLVR